MDIASELVFHFVRRLERLTLWAVIAVLIVLMATLAGGVLIAGHLLPASEPLIVAPLRWVNG
jgi:hypothetical protein